MVNLFQCLEGYNLYWCQISVLSTSADHFRKTCIGIYYNLFAKMPRKILYDLHCNNLVWINLVSDWWGRVQVHEHHEHVILLAACQLLLLQSCLGSGIWWTHPPNFASPNCKKFQSVVYLPTWVFFFIYDFYCLFFFNFYLLYCLAPT